MITIKILGETGSGKTTLALAMEQWLKTEGFSDVSVKDIDIECDTTYPEHQEKRLDAIKDRSVVIETIQLIRATPQVNNSV